MDSATISGITNLDIAADAAIDETKINFTGTSVALLTGDQTIAGKKTFSTIPEVSSSPVLDNQLARKAYVDDSKVKASADDTGRDYLDGKVKNSIEENGEKLQLVQDETNPTTGKVYGMGTAQKGWQWQEGLSNVVYQVTLPVNYEDANVRLYHNGTGGGENYGIAYGRDSGSWQTIGKIKLLKQPTVNVLKPHMYTYDAGYVRVTVDGTLAGTVYHGGGVSWSSSNQGGTGVEIDISSLTDGTIYDMDIEMKDVNDGFRVYTLQVFGAAE